MLETRVANQSQVASSSTTGRILSQSEPNPREHCQAIDLRSGKTLHDPIVSHPKTLLNYGGDEEQVDSPTNASNESHDLVVPNGIPIPPMFPHSHCPKGWPKPALIKNLTNFSKC